MSENKLRKYLRKPLPPVLGTQTLTPVILTDSKAKYLKGYSSTYIEKQIKWRYKSGQTSSQGYNWLLSNIDRLTGHLDNIHLYIWLGTCDLTDYNGTYITLSDDKDKPKKLIDALQNFITLLKTYPACKITIFEIPPYSIIDFNTSRGHSDPSIFKQQEEELLAKIHDINSQIRQINESLNTFSPNFAVDISHNHNAKTSKSKKITLRDKYLFNLYLDGIHPNTELGRVWLKKIAVHIQRDCWG